MSKLLDILGGGMLEMLRLRQPDRSKPCSKRRPYPTFLLPAEPPTWGAPHAASSYRKRIYDWNRQIVGDLNAFPYIVFVFYCAKVWLYAWLFATKVANRADRRQWRTNCDSQARMPLRTSTRSAASATSVRGQRRFRES